MEVLVAEAGHNQWIDVGPIKSALFSAFNGIVTAFDPAHYMSEAIFRADYSFEPSLRLWEAEYDYAVTEDEYLLHRAAGST